MGGEIIVDPLMKIVLEARRTSSTRRRNNAQINAADDDLENGNDDITDYSADVPDDPNVTPEDNPEDFTEGIPDAGEDDPAAADNTGENNPDAGNAPTPDDATDTPDYTEGMPGDDGTDEAPAGQGADPNNAPEPDPNAPAITAGDDTLPDNQTGNDSPSPADNSGQPAAAPDGATSPDNQDANPDPNADEAPPEDFTVGMPDAAPDDGTDEAPAGQGAQPADPNNPDTGGDDPAADPAAGDEQGAEDGDPDLDDMGEDDDPDSGAIQDSSDNGEDPKSVSELDKKLNKNMLRRSYIELYKTIDGFIDKIDSSDKESILATSTYTQVKLNLISLKDLVMEYIMQYFDKSDDDINLYNYNYFLQILRVNLEMIRVFKDTEEKINKKDE